MRDKAELGAIFTRLCEQVAGDLQRKGYVGKTIGIKLKYEDFQAVTRDLTLDRHTADPQLIRQTAGQCLKRAPLKKRLRLLGVRVGALLSTEEAEIYERNRALAPVEQARAAINLEADEDKTGWLF